MRGGGGHKVPKRFTIYQGPRCTGLNIKQNYDYNSLEQEHLLSGGSGPNWIDGCIAIALNIFKLITIIDCGISHYG